MALTKITSELLEEDYIISFLNELGITLEELYYDPSDNLIIYRATGSTLPNEDVWIELVFHHLANEEENLVTWMRK